MYNKCNGRRGRRGHEHAHDAGGRRRGVVHARLRLQQVRPGGADDAGRLRGRRPGVVRLLGGVRGPGPGHRRGGRHAHVVPTGERHPAHPLRGLPRDQRCGRRQDRRRSVRGGDQRDHHRRRHRRGLLHARGDVHEVGPRRADDAGCG